MQRGSSSKGFTLIELLCVIAIIAILAAILYPVFVGAKQQSLKTKCIGNLNQLSRAFRIYADDWGGKLPAVTAGDPRLDWYGGTYAGYIWPEKGQLYQYTRNASLYMCPRDWRVKAVDAYNVAMEQGKYDLAKWCETEFPLSYSMSGALNNRVLDTVRRPSQVMMLLHESRKTINDGAFAYADQPTHKSFDIPSDVHYTGTTIAYVDGHAIWRDGKELDADRKKGLWVPTR